MTSEILQNREMNFSSYDDFSLHLLSESSSVCDFPESASLFPEFQTLDTISNDVHMSNNIWLNDEPSPPALFSPQCKKRSKVFKNSSSFEYFSKEHFVTKTKNHYFKFKDDFLPDVDKELPDVILASPRKENTCESILPSDQYFNKKHVTDSNSTVPLYDDNPNVSFEDVLRKVEREMNLRDDLVTNEDIEYLEDLLAGVVDQPMNEILPQPTPILKAKDECYSDHGAFNEISCSLNSQQTTVSDSQSTIRKLLKSDSSNGHLEKKKSVEILSKTDESNGHLYEHNYSVTPHEKIEIPKRYPDRLLVDENSKSLQNVATPNTKFNEDSQVRLKKEAGTSLRTEIDCTQKFSPTSADETFKNQIVLDQTIVKDECESKLNLTAKVEEKTEKSYNDGCNEAKNSSPVLLDSPHEFTAAPNTTENHHAPPKKEKKKISVEEYLKKRAKRNANSMKSEPDTSCSTNKKSTLVSSSSSVPKIESIKTEDASVISYSNKIADIGSTMVKVSYDPPVVECKSKLATVSATIKTKPGGKELVLAKSKSAMYSEAEKISSYLRDEKVKTESKCSSVCSNAFSPSEISQSLDSCDQYSTSGISSYHNSSVSSLCGSPFTVSDEKSNDSKYPEKGERIKAETNSLDVSPKEIPFALNFDLLRKKSRHTSRRKHKHKKSKRHSSDSKTKSARKRHRRNSSDSCYEYDSSDSDSSAKRYPRKRLRSTSSSSSDRAYHSAHTERSLSPKSYHSYVDWNYANRGTVSDATFFHKKLPNMFYPPPPPTWHPEYAFFHPYPMNAEVPYYYDTRSYEYRAKIPCEAEKQRRVLFVGNIERGLSKEDFVARFSEFGEIESAKLHFKANGNNFGFIYFTRTEAVEKAIKHGNDNPGLPQYSYGYGCRKDRRDEPIFLYEKGSSSSEFISYSHPAPDSFDLKLKQFKSELCQKKLTALSSKSK